MLQRLWRWLRTMPRERWSWPRIVFRSPDRRGGTAHLVPLRFTTETADELQIRNDGPGDAAGIIVTTLLRPPPGLRPPNDAGRNSGGSLPYLAAGNRYILSLRPSGAALAVPTPGRWVRLQWRSASGEPGQVWACAAWDAAPSAPLGPVPPPTAGPSHVAGGHPPATANDASTPAHEESGPRRDRGGDRTP